MSEPEGLDKENIGDESGEAGNPAINPPQLDADMASGVGGDEAIKPPVEEVVEAVARKNFVTEGGLLRVMWKLALPMMAGVALHDVFTLVDMMWVGRLGAESVAAVSLSGVLMGVSFMLAFGISIGCLALVARMMGAGRPRDAGRVIGQAITLSLAISALMATLGLIFAERLMIMMGAEGEVIKLGAQYLRIAAVGSVALFMTFVLNTAMKAAADAMTPLKVTAIANVINIALDPILIFGWLGAPKLGVAGSALSTVISYVIALTIIMYVFFVKGHRHLELRKRDLIPEWGIIWRIIRIGIFGSGQAFVRNISALALVGIVTSYGMGAMAAYGIVIRLWFATIMLGTGIGAAAATMVGQNLGAGSPDRAAKSGWMAVGFFSVFGLIIGAVFAAAPDIFVGFFNDEAEVLAAGAPFLRMIGFTMVFTCVSVVMGRALQGAGDTLSPLIITALALLIIRIPLAYVLADAWDNVAGVWTAIAASNVMQGALFAGWFAVGWWKKKEV